MLAAQVSAVLQHHDRAGFLALATDVTTRSKMAMWWDNVDALGFTFGGAAPSGTSTAASDRHVDLGIGLHNPLDGTSTSAGGVTVPNSPTTWYRLTSAPGNGCLQRIAQWQDLSNAPWDEAERLTVVRTPHAVVAGPLSVASTVRRVAREAEKAARWDFSFFTKNNGQRYLDHLRQKGFVVFVPATDTQAAQWLRGYRAQSPSGWTADPTQFAGLTFPLESPQYPTRDTLPDTPGGPPPYQDTYVPAGGARVIVDRTATRLNDRGLEATLVHEFVHDLLSTYNTGFYFGSKGVDAAVTEGAARLLETYFYDSPDCYCKHHGQLPRAFVTLKVELRKHFGLFHGRYPTDAQLYGGNGRLANYYYDLAASTFDYEVYSGGVPFGLQTMVDAYINGGGPFDGVFLRYRGHTAIFANARSEQRKWARWLRNRMH
jgi:hypothetical protein